MIEVRIITNTSRKNVIVEPSQTIRQILEDNNINYASANVTLDGTPMMAGDHDRTLSDFNIKEKCFLSAVVKADGAY